MKLQFLLNRSLQEGKGIKEGSPTHYRIRQCIDSLDAYAASGAGVDALDALTPGWGDDFVAFLTRGADGRKPLSPATARERKNRLRTVLRSAIQRGELPNIPVFPEPDDDREYEFPRLAPPPLPNLPAPEAAKLLIASAKALAPLPPSGGMADAEAPLPPSGGMADALVASSVAILGASPRASLQLPHLGAGGAMVQGATNVWSSHGFAADPAYYEELKKRAKDHRTNPTPAEKIMWEILSNKNLEGLKFRRQHIIGKYIVDFACLKEHLIVEIDGGYHSTPEQQTEDRLRTQELNKLGYRVLRFTNDEVLTNPDSVITKILSEKAPPAPKWGSEAPLPPSGGMADASGASLGASPRVTSWLPHLGAGGATTLRAFLSRAELEALLLARAGKAPLPDDFLPAIERRILEAFSLTPAWYCIKCRGSMHYKEGRRHRTRKTTGTLLQTYLAAAIDGVEYYAPQDPIVTDRKGVKVVKNNRVLDELLFFRATRPQADAINRMLLAKRYGVIFHRREGESLEYCEIAERDLRRLRDFLGVKDAKRFPLLDFRNVVGKRVRVIAGIYEGYEGEVTRVAGADCFYVRIQGICAVATYAVDPDYLELSPL